jgi:hypothetical protein
VVPGGMSRPRRILTGVLERVRVFRVLRVLRSLALLRISPPAGTGGACCNPDG